MINRNLKKLSILHERCKEHPFRLDSNNRTIKGAKSYNDAWEELREEFGKQVELWSKKEGIVNPLEKWMFDHQLIGCYYMLPWFMKNIKENHKESYYKDYLKNDIVMLESYLQCIHDFLRADGNLTYICMDVGYREGDNSTWKVNPQRIIKIIYYPTLGKWDLDEYHCKQELSYYKKQIAYQENEMKGKEHPEYCLDRIKYFKKRIRDIKELLEIHDKN